MTTPAERLKAVWEQLEAGGHAVRRVPLQGRSDQYVNTLAFVAEWRLAVLRSAEAEQFWLPPEAS